MKKWGLKTISFSLIAVCISWAVYWEIDPLKAMVFFGIGGFSALTRYE